jgi:hypothetical protein
VNEALEKAWIGMASVLFSPPTRWLDPPPHHQQQDSIYLHPHSSGKPVKRTWGRTRLH